MGTGKACVALLAGASVLFVGCVSARERRVDQFVAALHQGQAEEVRRLLEEDASFRSVGWLSSAAEFDSPRAAEVMRVLLEHSEGPEDVETEFVMLMRAKRRDVFELLASEMASPVARDATLMELQSDVAQRVAQANLAILRWWSSPFPLERDELAARVQWLRERRPPSEGWPSGILESLGVAGAGPMGAADRPPLLLGTGAIWEDEGEPLLVRVTGSASQPAGVMAFDRELRLVRVGEARPNPGFGSVDFFVAFRSPDERLPEAVRGRWLLGVVEQKLAIPPLQGVIGAENAPPDAPEFGLAVGFWRPGGPTARHEVHVVDWYGDAFELAALPVPLAELKGVSFRRLSPPGE